MDHVWGLSDHHVHTLQQVQLLVTVKAPVTYKHHLVLQPLIKHLVAVIVVFFISILNHIANSATELTQELTPSTSYLQIVEVVYRYMLASIGFFDGIIQQICISHNCLNSSHFKTKH